MNEEQVRDHIAYKRSVGELDTVIADRMIAALDAGADTDYAALHRAALHGPLPAAVYHTSHRGLRASIARDGLIPGRPVEGRWGVDAAGQPAGVYVGDHLDWRGVWADEDEWDVWEIQTAGLTFLPDPLNRDCWYSPDLIPAAAVTFLGEYRHEARHAG